MVYLVVLPGHTSETERARCERAYTSEMRLEGELPAVVQVALSDDVAGAVVQAAQGCNLLVLGLTRVSRAQRAFSEVTRKIIASTDCPALVISPRG